MELKWLITGDDVAPVGCARDPRGNPQCSWKSVTFVAKQVCGIPPESLDCCSLFTVETTRAQFLSIQKGTEHIYPLTGVCTNLFVRPSFYFFPPTFAVSFRWDGFRHQSSGKKKNTTPALLKEKNCKASQNRFMKGTSTGSVLGFKQLELLHTSPECPGETLFANIFTNLFGFWIKNQSSVQVFARHLSDQPENWWKFWSIRKNSDC